VPPGTGVSVGMGVWEGMGVAEGPPGVCVGSEVGLFVGVFVDVFVGVLEGTVVADGPPGVWVGSVVGVFGVFVGVLLGVMVGVLLGGTVIVGVRVGVLAGAVEVTVGVLPPLGSIHNHAAVMGPHVSKPWKGVPPRPRTKIMWRPIERLVVSMVAATGTVCEVKLPVIATAVPPAQGGVSI
jgi:hypothetical protein